MTPEQNNSEINRLRAELKRLEADERASSCSLKSLFAILLRRREVLTLSKEQQLKVFFREEEEVAGDFEQAFEVWRKYRRAIYFTRQQLEKHLAEREGNSM